MAGTAIFLLIIALGGNAGSLAAEPEVSRYRGRLLLEVLESLEQSGLKIVYSSALVDRSLRVTVEPTATEPRAILDEILAPLGLAAREGPRDALLIVRAADEATPGSLRGRVLSLASGHPIPGATIRLAGTAIEAATRPDGTFEIPSVAPGVYEVTVAAHGFLPVTRGAVRIDPGEARGLSISMQAQENYLEEVVVTPSRLSLVQEEQASRLRVADDDAVLVPSFGGDVSRIVELLPGVAAADNSAAFNVRGSQVEDVAFVLDGLELYEPFHLLRFQSPFSLLDTSVVDRVDFLGGAFTADFGDRHGGIVKVTTWAPNEPHRTRIGVGTLNTQVSHGGPIPGRAASWLASARAWYPDSLRKSIELGETTLDPRFGDAYLSFSLNLSPQTVLSAHGLFAYDQLDFKESGGNETIKASSRSGYLWLRALHAWSDRIDSETTLSYGRLEDTRHGFSEPEDDVLYINDDRWVDFFGLRHDMSFQVSDTRLFKIGAEVRELDAEYKYINGLADDPASWIRLSPTPTGASYGVYGAFRAALTPRFATELGLRWDRQTWTDEHQVSPRINAIWKIGDRSEIRVGLGQYYQSQRLHELKVEDRETHFRPAELSRQAAVTFQHRFANDTSVRVDTYYRKLTHLRPRWENLFNPIELYPETEMDRTLVDADHARLRGAELLLRSSPREPFSWWLSYAWSRADDVIGGESVPRSWDQTHTGKFLVGYRLAETWTLSLSGTAHTGWPTTPVTGVIVTPPGGGMPEIEPVLGERNTDRFATYLRFDLKASRTLATRAGNLRLDLELLNLTDRRNPCCVDDFDFTQRPDGSIDTEPNIGYWLGLTPSFRIIWEF